MRIQLSQEPVQDVHAAGATAIYRSRLEPRILRPLRQALQEAARILDLPASSELSLLLTGDAPIQDLNRRYRSLDKPTDVLSFPQEDKILLGDIAISVDMASRQADKACWPLSSELALLGVHGLLHLAGFGDDTEEGAKDMEQLTRHILCLARIALPEEEHPFFQNR